MSALVTEDAVPIDYAGGYRGVAAPGGRRGWSVPKKTRCAQRLGAHKQACFRRGDPQNDRGLYGS